MPRPLAVLLCLLPLLAQAEPATLRIQGSNTIGAALGPALVRGLLQSQGAQDIRSERGKRPNETDIRARAPQGQPLLTISPPMVPAPASVHWTAAKPILPPPRALSPIRRPSDCNVWETCAARPASR